MAAEAVFFCVRSSQRKSLTQHRQAIVVHTDALGISPGAGVCFAPPLSGSSFLRLLEAADPPRAPAAALPPR
jgi:hypothetical protein